PVIDLTPPATAKQWLGEFCYFALLFCPMDCFFFENSFVRCFKSIFRIYGWLHPSFLYSPQKQSHTFRV
ncbi:hypothetical protein, partial [Faecalibacterium hattorii]|uniref:hypothetical protein n=1 Tax=Faecalibacterium hattorii TaxID=2935520 RepID=UPI003AAC26BF